MRFLIVEDEFVSRKKMEKILQELGEVDTVMNGKEALDAFKYSLSHNEPYDVIMLDIVMPDMNGHETLQKIRKLEDEFREKLNRNYDEVKVIMVSALKDSKNILNSFHEDGCDNYIIKPFSKEKVVEALEKVNAL